MLPKKQIYTNTLRIKKVTKRLFFIFYNSIVKTKKHLGVNKQFQTTHKNQYEPFIRVCVCIRFTMGYTSTMNPSFSHKTLLSNKNQSFFFSHKSFMGTNIILKKARLVAPLQPYL